MTEKWCVEYTIEKPAPAGWTKFDGSPAMDYKSDYEWYDDEAEANNKAQALMVRDDVIRLTLTKKVVLKG